MSRRLLCPDRGTGHAVTVATFTWPPCRNAVWLRWEAGLGLVALGAVPHAVGSAITNLYRLPGRLSGTSGTCPAQRRIRIAREDLISAMLAAAETSPPETAYAAIAALLAP